MGELMLVGYQINAIQAYLVLVILDKLHHWVIRILMMTTIQKL